MVTDKKFIPITGGGIIKLTGPCFKSRNKKVTCKFEHTETVGRITDLNTALCPLPLFTRLGQHRLWLSEDSGNTFNFYTMINIGKYISVATYLCLLCLGVYTRHFCTLLQNS